MQNPRHYRGSLESRPQASGRRGLSLIEVMLSIAIVTILAAAVATHWQPNIADRLGAVARIVAADLDYARGLAVNYSSRYRITFDVPGNRYVLTHSGTDPQLDTLPSSAYGEAGDLATQQTTDLGDLPTNHALVALAGVHRMTPAAEPVTSVEFDSLGATTRAEPTLVWLAAGVGDTTRYISISIDPVTGLTTISEVQSVMPLAAIESTSS